MECVLTPEVVILLCFFGRSINNLYRVKNSCCMFHTVQWDDVCPIIGVIQCSYLPKKFELFLFILWSLSQWDLMPMVFVCFGWTLLLMIPSAVELPVSISRDCCWWFISCRICLSLTALHAFMHSVPNFSLISGWNYWFDDVGDIVDNTIVGREIRFKR